MKNILIIVGLLVSLSCVNEDRKAFSQTTDERLSVYNNILNTLVEKHFYNLYLGEDFEKLEESFSYNRDKPEYLSELENLRRIVDSDTSMQSAICLRHKFSSIKWTQLGQEDLTDSVNFVAGLSKLLGELSTNHKGVYDSLTSPQKQFLVDRFEPSSYKVKTGGCSIGSISFSNIYFNKLKDRGLLYYEFYCGEKCGKGEVLLVEKKAGLWTIQKNMRLWIS